MWTYAQSTGKLYHGDQEVATGYSGLREGMNNPEMQAVKAKGPIPKGLWHIAEPINTLEHGPYVLPLAPDPLTDTLGRSGFLIHGDSLEHPGYASEGCIIMPRNIRNQIANSGDHLLTVVEE